METKYIIEIIVVIVLRITEGIVAQILLKKKGFRAGFIWGLLIGLFAILMAVRQDWGVSKHWGVDRKRDYITDEEKR